MSLYLTDYLQLKGATLWQEKNKNKYIKAMQRFRQKYLNCDD